MPRPIYNSALAAGLSQGFVLTFAGCLVAVFFTSSVTMILMAVLLLGISGGIVTVLARWFTEQEERNETDRMAIQTEFDREQQIMASIGIPPQILEPMQLEMQEQQEQRISELPLSLPEDKSSKAGLLYLFAGYLFSGIITGVFLYIADVHLVITAVMVLGSKFSVDLYKSRLLLKAAYPLTRSLFNIIATAIMFAGIYWLLKVILS